MKLTEVVKVQELAVMRSPTGDIGFSDLAYALNEVIGVENDFPNAEPDLKEIE